MKTTLFTLLIASFLLVPFSKSYSQAVNVNDSLALVDLYNSTDGAHWTNNLGWLEGPISTWSGVYVNGGRVQTLTLSENNLTGTMPSSLGKLSAMYFFDMSRNNLTGGIPSSLGKLINLTGFSLNDNKLTGSLPSSFNNLTKLTAIYLWNNQLTGPITVLEHCTNPEDFELNNNQFTGRLPNLQNMDKINLLNLNNNQLTGNIPASYGNFRGDQLTLSNNKLIGNIPTSLGNLTTTTMLWLSGNQLSGTVPLSLLNLPNYASLSLENNHLQFDGIEDIIKAQPPFYLTYAPQLNIPINYTPQGAFGKLSVHAGGTLSNNTYQWFKNNSLFKTNVGDSTFVPDAEGVYSVKVNNSVVTNLLLVSDNITIVTACASAPVNTTTTNIQSTSAKVSWSASQGAIKYTVQFNPVSATTFSSVTTKTATATLKNLLPNTQYVWKVRATCSLQNSAFTALNNFTSPPSFAGISQANSVSENPGTISIYPNPVKDVIRIKGLKFNSEAVITILDVQGRKIINAANSKTNEIDVKQLNAGTYFVRIEADKNVTTLKFVKE